MSERKEKTVSIRAKGNTTHSSPSFNCSNCNCSRYNPCGCQKGVRKKE